MDEVLELDTKIRELKLKGDNLRQERNTTSNLIGSLIRDQKQEEANEKKERVVEINKELETLEKEEPNIK